VRPLRALFVCDGSATVGGGHVMRSLTLARALAARGWNSTFLADAFVGGVLDRFDRVGCERLPTADQTPDGLMAAAAGVSGFSAVIVDHFEMRATHERGFRRCAPLTAAVDDLPDRPRDVDLLIDCNQCRTSDDYAVLGAGVELLLGPAYAPVRLEFAAARRATLARRGAPAPMRRVLVALGLTDVGGITERVVRALLPHFGEASVDVVLGETAPSADAMRRLAAADPRVRLHVNGRAMAALPAEAYLGVGAGGSPTWERATLGVACRPSVWCWRPTSGRGRWR